MNSKSSTGARVEFKMGNDAVLYANALNYTIAHAHQPVDVLGKLEPEEYSEVGYTVNFTCTMFRISNQGAEKQGLRPQLQNILRQEELSVTLMDKVSNVTLVHITGVKCTQEDFTVSARDIGQLTLNFVGIIASTDDIPSSTSK